MPFCTPIWPFVGSAVRLMRDSKDPIKQPLAPFVPIIREDFGPQPPSIVGIINLFMPMLIITDSKYLQEFFMTKNKYFDKSPMLEAGTRPLLGSSTLM